MVSSSIIARLLPDQPFAPYVVAAVFQALAVLWALFLIPETRVWSIQAEVEAVEEDEREHASLRSRLATTLLSPLKPLELLWPTRSDETGRRSWNLFWLGFAAFVSSTGVS